MPANVATSREAPPLTLGRLVVLVEDYDAALAFYRSAFGACVLFDAPAPSGGRYLHVGFGSERDERNAGLAAGAGIWLLRAADMQRERVGHQTGGEPLAVFYTPDVRAAVQRAEAAGATVVRALDSVDGASFAHVADLYGNVFVLVQMENAGVAPPA
jgi:predicted enzyme related to lactoylglutathione lyase